MVLVYNFIFNANAWEGLFPNFPQLSEKTPFFKLGKDSDPWQQTAYGIFIVYRKCGIHYS